MVANGLKRRKERKLKSVRQYKCKIFLIIIMFRIVLLFSLLAFASSTCMEARLEAQSNNLIGVYVPQCQEDADYYKKLQCHGGTGECWCTDTKTGEKRGEAFRLWELNSAIDLTTHCD